MQIGMGLGLTGCAMYPRAAAAPSGPTYTNLITNGDFASGSAPPTISLPARLAITSGQLVFNGGAGGNSASATWGSLGGVVAGASYVIAYTSSGRAGTCSPRFTVGGTGLGVTGGDGSAGAHIALVTADSSNTDFRITFAPNLAGQGVSLDDVALYRSLVALSFGGSSAISVGEETAVGEAVGTLSGVVSGSTLELTDDAGGKFVLDGSIVRIAAALDYETATSHSITVRETLVGAYDSPKVTTLTINVTDYAPTLGMDWTPFFLTDADAAGTVAGTISVDGAAGSTLSLFDDAGGAFDLSGLDIVTTATLPAGTYSVTVRETNADGVNSPYDVTHDIEVVPA
jgi:hypothetical protein